MAITLDGTSGITTPGVTNSGNDTIAGNETITGTLTAASFNAASTFGFKNRIINGAMGVAQRGTSFTPSANANSYTLDRWAANRNSVANYTVSQQGTSGAYSLRLQRDSGNASTETLRLRQVIESCNCADMAGSQATLSLTVTAGANYSGGANCYISICTGSGIDQGLTSMVSNTWTNWLEQYIAITPTTTATKYSLTVTIPAGTNEVGILIQYVPSGTAGTNDWIQITNVQLEKGSTATTFDYRPYGTELQLCQRYYWMMAKQTTGTIIALTNMSYYNATYLGGHVTFPVTMRTAPSLDAASGTNYYIMFRNNGSNTVNSWTIVDSQPQVANIFNSSQASGTAGQAGWSNTNASGAYVAFSAEL